jgi:hypothetical protein
VGGVFFFVGIAKKGYRYEMGGGGILGPNLNTRRALSAKLQRLQPLDVFTLILNDLRLPNQSNAHY